MSSDTEEVNEEEPRCASCGITQCDGTKLMKCTACHLARYCSVACQKEHWPKHKRQCKKRAAELREERLFKQPESTHFGDCPICCLPMSLDASKSTTMMCCFTLVCRGCALANDQREIRDSLERKCPFCRHPIPKSKADIDKCLKKRVESSCPAALHWMGHEYYQTGDFDSALNCYTKAASLKYAASHYNLSNMYQNGVGVEKNAKMEKYHLEEAAIGGHPDARYFLACYESNMGNYELTVKHFSIAARQGDKDAIEALKTRYQAGLIKKEDFAAVLRAHKAAIDATESPQRKIAESAQYVTFT